MRRLCSLGLCSYLVLGAALLGLAYGQTGTPCEHPKDCVDPDDCADEQPANTDGTGTFMYRSAALKFCSPRQVCCKMPNIISPYNRKCGDKMECITPTLCSDNGTLIVDGSAFIDFRSASSAKMDKLVCHWSEVCCALDNQKPQPVQEYVTRGCGYSNPNGYALALTNTPNGESNFGEFPWIVRILAKKCVNCLVEPVGAGSLLAPNVVITIAHNIDRIATLDLTVRAGEWDTQTIAEPKAHEDRKVRTKVIHEQFTRSSAINDVALLILETPFKLNDHIDTICYSENQDILNEERCLVMGWGKRDLRDADYPHILKKIELPFINGPHCQKKLRRTRLGPRFHLHDSFVCAGGEKDRDACFGDGGAPLVCPLKGEPNRYQLAGIVSWGLGCGQENVPGVYANVQYLRQWILQKLRALNMSY